ncbi:MULTISPECIES: ROK family transcriptional regulator [unclassified Pseudodesulfovibrio]|uniref:ROK family transcriptional regulator n=1 Tax=unclassified Pseudodesulfovibrio TaxID=2661612 RepID=UPI000FEC0ABF|nr:MULTISPECIES: ROK family transcriptional regulator [unclassified Pseudodesulfovibrio]MCJ2164524.1 ROK family transcriptional regulator [Pseudodesulfovibrio sp. S3-i]RWU04723.1 ROK family transcriptional regulator [Pseudodesulfovibrio sp. S3]
MKAANQDFTRAVNQFNILNSIREAGRISRVEIAERTGQSRASVTNITAAMISQGLIREEDCGCKPKRGRRRIMLTLNPEAAHVVGVKISAFQVSFAVVDFVGDVKSSLTMPIRVSERSEATVADFIEDGVRHCVEDARLRMEDIAGCGLGISGFVDSATGTCMWTPLKKGQSNIRAMVSARLNMDVYIENDANSVTVASQWFGLGKGIDNFLVVTMEHGVGMGIVVDGKLYRGSSGIGAEFGHVVLVPDGEPCRCGKFGCVEAYACDGSILRRAKEQLSRRRGSIPNLETLIIEDVTSMAKAGDTGLQKLFREAGTILGQGIAGLIQIFNPERVIVTGEGVRAGDLVYTPMRRAMKKFLNKELLEATEIVIQAWGDNDWARGAAGFVLSELYKSPLDKIHRSR